MKVFKDRMLRNLVGFIMSLFWGSGVNASDEPTKVLFIGNSYTHMNKMPKLFERIAKSKGDNVLVKMSAKSSHTFEMHTKREEMFYAIRSEKWDYVVVQGFSREMTFDQDYIDSASTPYFDHIIDSVYQNNPCSNVLLYMTWGYKNGHGLREEIDSYQKMTDRVTAGYKYYSDKYDIPIAPVGHVWREIRNSSEINLYQPDEQHPTYHGSYLAACTFYTSIFKSSPFGAYSGSLSDVDSELIQNTAFNYVSQNEDQFKLNRSYAVVRPQEVQGKDYLIDVKAIYPQASSILWDFGDGNTSDKPELTHRYRKHGQYNIELVIEDVCGTRKYQKTVTFKKQRRPKRKKEDRQNKEMVLPNRSNRTNE